MKRGFGKGFSMLELLIVLLVLSLLLLPTMAYFNRYHRAMLFDSTAEKIVEAVGLAREYAVNERKEFYVVFGEEGFIVLRENKEPVCKEQKFPANVAVNKKSAGFDPVILKPDGTAQTAGYLILGDSVDKKEVKIVLHNLTGRCFIARE
ncbi:MAG: GspH/FimT family protein [Candidatus Omnitrophica bacterium]|nr:GspH/FimT family protein [Candidatus Omnitrophota bacterium]